MNSYFEMPNQILLKSTQDYDFIFSGIEAILDALDAKDAQAAIEAHVQLQVKNRQLIEALINKSYPTQE